MTVNPSPMKRAFICPLCGEPIEAMTPEETVNAPTPEGWEPDLSAHPLANAAAFRHAQNTAANEALIQAHLLSNHTMEQALRALGTARNALMEIVSMAEAASHGGAPMTNLDYALLANRGLGGK